VAKEKQQQPSNKAHVKPKGPEPVRSSGSFTRNAVIILILTLVFFGIYKSNDYQDEFQDLRSELNELEQRPDVNEQRINEIKHRLNEIHNDTGFVKTLFLGYYVDVHNVAFGINKQLDKAEEEIIAQKTRFHLDNPEDIKREDKLRLKVNTYVLLERINEYSPPNSVILLPPSDSLVNDQDWKGLSDPIWVEYFIYPRLCLSSGTEAKNPNLAKRITHVLIVKGIGYDKLKYTVPPEKRERLCLLPINQPDDSTKISN
jgi:hypothetical protein